MKVIPELCRSYWIRYLQIVYRYSPCAGSFNLLD